MESSSIKKRVLGALEYDRIPSEQRIEHLMQQCGLSKYLARRALQGYLPSNGSKAVGIAKGLAVSMDWLWLGTLNGHPRTLRIHFFTLNYPQDIIDGISRLLVATMMGSKKAENICDMVENGKLSLPTAARMI